MVFLLERRRLPYSGLGGLSVLLLLLQIFGAFGAPQQDLPSPPSPPEPTLSHKVIRGENHTDLEGDSGIFKSPNFPSFYPQNSNVTWKITVPTDKEVELTFHLLNLEKNQYCSWDWVKVFDAETHKELRQLCGYLQQDLILQFNTSSIIVEFRSDSVSQRTGFLASWRPAAPKDSEKEEGQKERVEGYILTIPQSITASEEAVPEEACLEIFNVDSKGKVFINVFSSENVLSRETNIYHVIDYEPESFERVQCFDLRLPSNFSGQYAILQINGTFEDEENYRILSYKSVKVIRSSPQVLIQTDKKEYRPKQTVLFRVIKLDESLKPSKNNVLNRVFVKSPSRQILAQYLNVSLDPRGIGQFEYMLDEEPELGNWDVTVENDAESEKEDASVASASFVVNEAVLPKFEVVIKSPAVILGEDEKVEFEICGIYTHGSKVRGELEVFFDHRYRQASYWRAPTFSSNFTKKIHIKDDNACGTVSLNRTEISLLSKHKETPFTIKATLTEEGTEIQQESRSEGKVTFTKAEIDFGDSATEHILGEYPYVVFLRLVEHGSQNPLKGEKVEVCSRLWKDLNNFQNLISSSQFYSFDEDQYYDLGKQLLDIKFKETCLNLTTSTDDGSLTLGIPLSGVPLNVTKLGIKVTALSFVANETTRMELTSSKFDVSLTHLDKAEGTDSHRLTIREKLVEERKVKFDCEGASNFTVYFQGKMDETVDLNYIVSSGGSLIASGNHRVLVDSNDTMKYLDGLSLYQELGYVNSSSEVPSGENVLKSHVISLSRPFPLEGKVTKIIKLLIYTRDIETGETLSHVREYETESCAPRPVLEWNPVETNPGKEVSLKIKSKPQSLCAYSVIDKSADLIENPNKMTSERIQQLREDLSAKRIPHDQVSSPSECMDAKHLFKAMENIGLYILSDTLIQDPSCNTVIDSANFDGPGKEDHYKPVPEAIFGSTQSAFAPGMSTANRLDENYDDFSQKKEGQVSLSQVRGGSSIEVRDYFPETWLFDLVDLKDDEETIIKKEAPHTITTWIAEAFCSHPDSGLSVARRASLKASQDFFADLNAPYSVKRGEVLQINATVFNKVQGPLPMKLSVEESPEEAYEIIEKTHEVVCVNTGGNVHVDFYIRANKLDVVNITIKAEIVKDEACGSVSEDAIGFTDILKKAIHVKPEGFPQEVTKSYFLCGEQKDTPLEDIIAPEEGLVKDSVRFWTGLSGDIMAPAVKNLDSLVALPTGCGEQTMIRMVPNIYLLDYLKSVGKSLPELEAKAKGYIQTGFDRQNRKFRHRDGAYSIWGPKDSEEDGSMWLTAYVVKAFSQASKYIKVDEKLLKKSVKWIIKRQDFETGCFHNEGYAYSVNSPRETLTSHVLVTLFEAKYTAGLGNAIDSKVLNKALRCLKNSHKEEINEEDVEEEEANAAKNKTKSLYALSLETYAVHLLETQAELKKEIGDAFEEIKGEKLFKELLERSERDEKGFLHWGPGNDSSLSMSVEMTAYNVMSLLFRDELTDALSAIRWMSTHRNQRGGFVSTQDTVVALQAISRYSSLVYENETKLDVKLFNGTGLVKDFNIDEDNKLLFKRMKMDGLVDLKVSSEGKGCYALSTMARYNINNQTDEVPKFQIRTEGNSSYLHICASYIGDRERTNMALLEVELLSGYEVIEDSLALLLNQVESGVEKYEIMNDDDKEEERKFVLYFNALDQGRNACWDVQLKRVNLVKDLKPAIIKIYDYYAQEDAFSTSYII